jgi:hypothetical protein
VVAGDGKGLEVVLTELTGSGRPVALTMELASGWPELSLLAGGEVKSEVALAVGAGGDKVGVVVLDRVLASGTPEPSLPAAGGAVESEVALAVGAGGDKAGAVASGEVLSSDVELDVWDEGGTEVLGDSVVVLVDGGRPGEVVLAVELASAAGLPADTEDDSGVALADSEGGGRPAVLGEVLPSRMLELSLLAGGALDSEEVLGEGEGGDRTGGEESTG